MKIRAFEARYAIATIVWCGIILWASVTADPLGGEFLDVPQADKIVHFCGYALLCWLASMSLRKAIRPYRAGSLIIAPPVFSIAFGVLNEIIQMRVAYRDCESADIVADTLGAMAVQIAFLYVQRKEKNSGDQAGGTR